MPYAIHLLSFRRETPHVGGDAFRKSTSVTQTSGVDGGEIDETGQRILRKRLRWVFDPLVLSMGDSADNISFLLRMTELAGKYDPIRPTRKSLPASQLSYASKNEVVPELESAKLKVVCAAAREVLLSFVKKDVY